MYGSNSCTDHHYLQCPSTSHSKTDNNQNFFHTSGPNAFSMGLSYARSLLTAGWCHVKTVTSGLEASWNASLASPMASSPHGRPHREKAGHGYATTLGIDKSDQEQCRRKTIGPSVMTYEKTSLSAVNLFYHRSWCPMINLLSIIFYSRRQIWLVQSAIHLVSLESSLKM